MYTNSAYPPQSERRAYVVSWRHRAGDLGQGTVNLTAGKNDSPYLGDLRGVATRWYKTGRPHCDVIDVDVVVNDDDSKSEK